MKCNREKKKILYYLPLLSSICINSKNNNLHLTKTKMSLIFLIFLRFLVRGRIFYYLIIRFFFWDNDYIQNGFKMI